MDDEDFSMENSDSSDTVESSCSSKEHYPLDKKSEDHSNEKGFVAKHTSKRRELSDCNDEKEINPRAYSDRAERINKLHSKGQSCAGTEREDKAASSIHLPDENNVDSDSEVQEKLPVDDEMSDKEEGTKKPTKKKPVTSRKHYDFIRILSDSVLNKGADFDKEESDEETKQEPGTSIHSSFEIQI
ncbi:SNF2 domain-containing protein CLASSY 4-like [Abeliophyllum distichum]|uniref:SNF2 domain-containing protein CLASSY 4-like n=1 Tax=Abeliophyllum distichum TaxID=126358 RepID=A0ABD1VRG5_9LAMI